MYISFVYGATYYVHVNILQYTYDVMHLAHPLVVKARDLHVHMHVHVSGSVSFMTIDRNCHLFAPPLLLQLFSARVAC